MLTYQLFFAIPMGGSNKVLFIVNKHAGTGYSSALEKKILEHCGKRGLGCTIEFTHGPGHGIALAKMAVEENMKMVFAVGGDGTVNEVAQGLVGSAVTLGILPKGSGNGLARHLKIPLSMEDALSMLDMDKTKHIDTIQVNGRLSINVSGIGFDGHVAGLFARDGKRGPLTYGKHVVGQFNKFKTFDCEVVVDGKVTKENLFSISFANSSQFGNNAYIAPSASLCDQLIDVCMVDKMNTWQGLRFVLKLFNKSLTPSKQVRLFQAREIQMSTNEEVPYHIDGEAAGTAVRFDIRINPSTLWVSLPAHAGFI